MAKKKFSEMTPIERQAWVTEQAKRGRISDEDVRPVVERIRDTLREEGPMTNFELAEKLGYSSHASLTTWANKNYLKMKQLGVLRHVSPDDGKTRIWMLKSHLGGYKAVERGPTILERMKSAGIG